MMIGLPSQNAGSTGTATCSIAMRFCDSVPPTEPRTSSRKRSLPKGIAEAFFLRELDGMTAEEVQQMLGITPANFWKRLHRAHAIAAVSRNGLVWPGDEAVLSFPERFS
jgi:Sigma-70, region 4